MKKPAPKVSYRKSTLRVVLSVLLTALLPASVLATEGSGCVYPIGAETVLPGFAPVAGQTIFAEFNTTYQANNFLDGGGHSSVPGFNLSVYAFAPKISHNWGLHLLGGDLVNWVATPVAYEQLETTAAGKYSARGFANPIIGTDIAYHRGSWHWWYGLDLETPAPVYHKSDTLNVGQHNFATTPAGAFTYLHGKTEISSRFEYIINYTDSATQYHSGNEFLWEYVAMQNVTKKLAVGANGYFYQQTTDDQLLGAVYNGGNRGRNLAIGPEVHYQLGSMILIGKYFRDTLVENRPSGNAFWVELALPLSHRHPNE